MSDPETATAGEALERTFLERTYNQMREWWSQRRSHPVKWWRAAFVNRHGQYLTAEELTAVLNELQTIVDRYADREDEQRRPDGALPVRFHAHGHLLPPTPSGN